MAGKRSPAQVLFFTDPRVVRSSVTPSADVVLAAAAVAALPTFTLPGSERGIHDLRMTLMPTDDVGVFPSSGEIARVGLFRDMRQVASPTQDGLGPTLIETSTKVVTYGSGPAVFAHFLPMTYLSFEYGALLSIITRGIPAGVYTPVFVTAGVLLADIPVHMLIQHT